MRTSVTSSICWEDHPAEEWLEAYPIGNGRLGAMIFGGIKKERVQMNLDSLWYGGHVDRLNPAAKENLGKVRKLISEGKISQAEELLTLAFSGLPQSQRPFQPLGDLEITYGRRGDQAVSEQAQDYRRELDLEHGLVRESFVLGKGKIEKTYFASWPAKVLVIHIEASAGISFSAILRRRRFYEHSGSWMDRGIFMDGQSGPDGVRFYAGAAAASGECGNVQTIGEHLLGRDCQEVTVIISGETSFYEEDPRKTVQERIKAAMEKGYERLLEEHVEDYQSLYERVNFHLGADDLSEEISLPLHRRMKERPEDLGLAETYFNFCRYLMISGSRPDSLPLNLQGIWCEEMEPAWDSKYTININTEMNYWPAESCNLSSCHQPLFRLIRRVKEMGQRTAREMYGCRGFTAHHNTDIWADTEPQDIYIPASYWVMGGAWLCTHIMNHYRYTKDKDFLKENFSCLEEAVLFFEDFLIEDQGEFVTSPSVSPENTYIMKDGTEGCICAGSTMDVEILNDVFDDYLEAAGILGIASQVTQRAEEMRKRFPKLKIGKHGQIQEWREDYEEKEPGHRHISQLYGLYPSRQISWEKTPALAQAAEKTLARRLAYGGGHTGWSCAWIVCMYARLEDGEKAHQNLMKLFGQSTAPNLMDTHPRKNGCVFQIDGNMGALAGIVEMLVHAEEDQLLLLPALPPAWPEGRIQGIRIMNDGEIDLQWSRGQVQTWEIQAGKEDLELMVKANQTWQKVQIPAGMRKCFTPDVQVKEPGNK